MNYISFGSTLREARIRNGYELNTVAKDLRIRPDILRAIEDSDFDRMPPRGYARNMINAYARYLGLNADEITRAYLDEQYASDVSSSRVEHDNTISTRRASARTTSQFATVRNNPNEYYQGGRNPRPSSSGYSRDVYTMDEENEMRSVRAREMNAQRQGYQPRSNQNVRQARRASVPQGQYGNMYSQPQNGGLRSKLPIIVIIIAILIVIFVIYNVVSCHNKQVEEANTIPVTGAEETQVEEKQVETAPTSFTFEYDVADGTTAYIELYVDGNTELAQDVTGPKTDTITSSDTVKFVCVADSGVTVKLNGEEQTLTYNSSGICTLTYNFNDILSAWYDAHPDVTRPAGLTSSSTSSTSSNSTTSSSTSTSSTSSSSSSSKTTSSSSSSN